jgi:hypothetical protein
LQNPNVGTATVDITYMLQGGGTITRQHIIDPESRYTVVTHDPGEVGLDQAFSSEIASDVPIIVERAMYWANGGHNTIGLTGSSTAWYLAEGYTGSGFETFILLQNPNVGTATVDITYMLQGGGTITRQHIIDPESRYTVVTHDPGEVGVDQAFSSEIVSDVAIIVERAMYFSSGGHNTIGVASP